MDERGHRGQLFGKQEQKLPIEPWCPEPLALAELGAGTSPC